MKKYLTDRTIQVSIFLITFSCYFLTSSRTLTLEDSGEFLMMSFFNSMAHPPGYPLITFFGHIFSKLPLSSIPLSIHLVSILFGALSCVVLYRIGRLFTQNKLICFVTSLAFAFSDRFWSQSIIIEVYSLNVFFFSILYYQALKFFLRDKIRPWLFFLCLGLSLSNHWPLIVVSSPGIFLLFLKNYKVLLKKLYLQVSCFFLGLLPYLWMYYNTKKDQAASFYGPLPNFDKLFYTILRKGYADVENQINLGLVDKLGFLRFFSSELFFQFSVIGFFIGMFGLYKLIKNRKYVLSCSLLLIFLGNSIVLIATLNFQHNYLWENAFINFPLIAYFVWGIFILQGMIEICASREKVLGPAFIILPLLILFINFEKNNQKDYVWAKKYAEVILNSLEPNAIIILRGDTAVNPIGYMNLVEKVRPDVTLYNDLGLMFKNRLVSPFGSSKKNRRERIISLVQRSENPVYVMIGEDEMDLPFGQKHYGLFRKLLKYEDSSVMQLEVKAEILDYMNWVLDYDPKSDRHTLMHKQEILKQFGNFFTYLVDFNQGNASSGNYLGQYKKLMKEFYPSFSRINLHLKHNKKHQIEQLWSLSEKMITKIHITLPRDMHAHLYYLRAHIAFNRGKKELAIENFNKSIEIFPHPTNPAFNNLKQLGR